jgi:hypothetical protein
MGRMGGRIDTGVVVTSKRKSIAEAQRALRFAEKRVDIGLVTVHAGIIDT